MKEKRKIGEILNETGKRNYFTVPDGYFNELPGRVIGKIKAAGDQAPAGNKTVNFGRIWIITKSS